MTKAWRVLQSLHIPLRCVNNSRILQVNSVNLNSLFSLNMYSVIAFFWTTGILSTSFYNSYLIFSLTLLKKTKWILFRMRKISLLLLIPHHTELDILPRKSHTFFNTLFTKLYNFCLGWNKNSFLFCLLVIKLEQEKVMRVWKKSKQNLKPEGVSTKHFLVKFQAIIRVKY